MTTVVLKLGGSLYDLPDLGERTTTLFAQFPEHRFLVFPGGGAAADLVRKWQTQFGWTDARAHDVAIASLDFNAAMLARILPESCVVRERDDAEHHWKHDALPVLAPMQFLNIEECVTLPQNWDVTSDSLAGCTAIHWPADELWLCKSVPCPTSLPAAIADGLVDPHFARLTPHLPQVRWCDLRNGSPLREWNVRG